VIVHAKYWSTAVLATTCRLHKKCILSWYVTPNNDSHLSIEIWVITIVDVRLAMEWLPVTVVLSTICAASKRGKTTI
jgi:hypothetical protein